MNSTRKFFRSLRSKAGSPITARMTSPDLSRYGSNHQIVQPLDLVSYEFSETASSIPIPSSPISMVASRHCPKLPQEVWDAVIDHLWRHRHTLRACSLTCRSWTHRAQSHLHRSFSILCPRLDLNPDIYSSSKVALHVRHLRAILLPAPPAEGIEYLSVEDVDDLDDICARRQRNVIHLWRVLSRLTRLQTMELSGFRWTIRSLEAMELASSVFRGITILDINGAFEGVHAFLGFLTLFPRLSALKVGGLTWVSRETPGPFSLPASPTRPDVLPCQRLRVLSFIAEGCGANVLRDLACQWLASLASHGVNGLRVQWHPYESSRGLPELLRALGPSIDQLEISTDHRFPETDLESLGE